MTLFDLSGQTVRDLEKLPEELQFTEHDWYEYHYYLKRNLFLLRKLHDLPQRVQNIYVVEPSETYIGSVLNACGYHVRYGHTDTGIKGTGGYDVVLLLNILERQSQHPGTFLRRALSLLNDDGKIILTTDNAASFRNRMKLLYGLNTFPAMDGSVPFCSRQFVLSDLYDIIHGASLRVQESRLIGPYQPFRIGPLTLSRYLLKYFSFIVMKAIPGFRDTIFIMAERDSKKD